MTVHSLDLATHLALLAARGYVFKCGQDVQQLQLNCCLRVLLSDVEGAGEP